MFSIKTLVAAFLGLNLLLCVGCGQARTATTQTRSAGYNPYPTKPTANQPTTGTPSASNPYAYNPPAVDDTPSYPTQYWPSEDNGDNTDSRR